jgi:hypothetical protein
MELIGNTMSEDKKKNWLYLVGLLLLVPSDAFAHGDPSVLYSFISIALLHCSLAVYLAVSKRFVGLRVPFFGVFVVNAVMSWAWAIGYKGPSFANMYIGLIGAPTLTFFCLFWLRANIHRIRLGKK